MRRRVVADFRDPDWVRFYCPSFESALAGKALWEARRVQLGSPPGSVALVLTGDPRQPWAVEVRSELAYKGGFRCSE